MSVAAQFAIVPNFSNLSLPDDATVADALHHVFRARNQAVDKSLVQEVTRAGYSSVGDLRGMTDGEWKKLQVPTMCRIYLKYAVRQSVRRAPGAPKTFLDDLADDFNFGQPFDLSLYQTHLKTLTTMGFNNEEAMEALVVTENKGIEGALEILFQKDKAVRAKKRSDALIRLKRQAPGKKHKELAPAGDPQAAKNLKIEVQKRQRLELELKTLRSKSRIMQYTAFLKGLTAGESIGLLSYQAFQTYQKEKNITEEEHSKAVENIGLSLSEFADLQNFENKNNRDAECVVCLDNVRDHASVPCMHMCLCDECAEDFRQPRATCPMCNEKITDVIRIFQ